MGQEREIDGHAFVAGGGRSGGGKGSAGPTKGCLKKKKAAPIWAGKFSCFCKVSHELKGKHPGHLIVPKPKELSRVVVAKNMRQGNVYTCLLFCTDLCT